jgi:hypothetical protein
MKRKGGQSPAPAERARKSAKVIDYCNVPHVRDLKGDILWPAPARQMTAARAFLKEWYGIPSQLIK